MSTEGAVSSKIITVSLLIQDLKKDSDFFGLPGNIRDTNVIKDIILKKYHTDIGILEGFIDGERFFFLPEG